MADTDKKSLNPGQWLTDRIISYAINKIKEEEEIGKIINGKDVQYIDPCVVHLIGRFSNVETCREIIEETKMKDSKITFFPLNNNTEKDREGGSHWSVLVYRKLSRKGEFLHFDPIKGMNETAAQEMLNKLNKIEKIHSKER